MDARAINKSNTGLSFISTLSLHPLGRDIPPAENPHPVDGLDASIIQNHLLTPILAIDDPRTSDRIDFVGGIRGVAALEKAVDSGEFALAISMYPVDIKDLIAVADADLVMPPKSTWFEPKLRSGLLVHTLD